ncbi:hypothetical protein S100390_v1c00700 [Spiroplasma sp. NBRC 100390]|uniref:hypothetical protein n=1 Tax=unclassified Spiroplasma TaxID=2637901 RepID=UPI0008929CBA|nr:MULTISPECIES: hypothetical protein [unclassified Spiroplasma]AOX43413.1 hypothetical protein STU14_v1c00700 [Spiroplasma sp. TU-14]APE12883.1 hypothetical protein S100390_v1c00700 [Spiroplasma sp. NBRC 100390]
MTPSFYIYFAFIPAAVFFIIWMIIRVIEKHFHRYLYYKNHILFISGAVCSLAVLIIIIVSFFIK